jgi:WD40 repeat protein
MTQGLIQIAALLSAIASADTHLGPVTDLVVLGEQVYSCSQAGIFMGLGKELHELSDPPFRVTSVAMSSELDGLLLVAGGKPGELGVVSSWHPTAEESSAVHKISKDLIYDLAMSPDGKVAATAGASGEVLVCRLPDLSAPNWIVRHKHTAAARAVAFSPDGKWLASAGLDGVVLISSVGDDGKPQALLDHTAGIECLAWSPDSGKIASGSKDSKVRLHEVSGKLIRTYSGLGMEQEPVAGRVLSRVLSLAWNGRALVAGTSKGSLYRLSLEDDGTEQLMGGGANPVFALAFGPDGKLLIGRQDLTAIELER